MGTRGIHRGGQERAFFVYDHQKHDETFDPKDAILYFYPPSMDVGDQIALVGGIIGTLDFCMEVMQTVPTLITLTTCKFALLKSGPFVVGLSGDLNAPEQFVKDHLQYLWQTFCLFQGSLMFLQKRIGQDTFGPELHKIWDSYFSRCQGICDPLSESFAILPYKHLSPSHSGIFLEASHILQRAQCLAGVVGGVLLNKDKILCTQLSPSLTRQLLILMPQNNSIPCIQIKNAFDLPAGVRLLYVFLTTEELSSLGPRKREEDSHIWQHQKNGTAISKSSAPLLKPAAAKPAARATVTSQPQSPLKVQTFLSAVAEAESDEVVESRVEVSLPAEQSEAAQPRSVAVMVVAEIHRASKDEDTGEVVASWPPLPLPGAEEHVLEATSGDRLLRRGSLTTEDQMQFVGQQSPVASNSHLLRKKTSSEVSVSDSSQATSSIDAENKEGDSNRDSTEFSSADDGGTEPAERNVIISKKESSVVDEGSAVKEAAAEKDSSMQLTEVGTHNNNNNNNQNHREQNKNQNHPEDDISLPLEFKTISDFVPELGKISAVVNKSSSDLSKSLVNGICGEKTESFMGDISDPHKKLSHCSAEISKSCILKDKTEEVSDQREGKDVTEPLCLQSAAEGLSTGSTVKNMQLPQPDQNERTVQGKDGSSQNCPYEDPKEAGTSSLDHPADRVVAVKSESSVMGEDSVVQEAASGKDSSRQLTNETSVVTMSAATLPAALGNDVFRSPSSSLLESDASLGLEYSDELSLSQDPLLSGQDSLVYPATQIVHSDSKTTVMDLNQARKCKTTETSNGFGEDVSISSQPVPQGEQPADMSILEKGTKGSHREAHVVKSHSLDLELNLSLTGNGTSFTERLKFDSALLTSNSSGSRDTGQQPDPSHTLSSPVEVQSNTLTMHSNELSSSDMPHSPNESSSAVQSSSTAPSTPGMSGIEQDAAMWGKKKVALYVQGHSDTLLVLVIKDMALLTRETVNILWKSSLARLAELDFSVSDANDASRDDLSTSTSSHLYLKYCSASQGMQGTALPPVTSLANELAASSVYLHDTFSRMPSTSDILCRTHTTCCYGHKNFAGETYFQMATPRGGGMVDPRDTTLALDQVADRRLYNDYSSDLL